MASWLKIKIFNVVGKHKRMQLVKIEIGKTSHAFSNTRTKTSLTCLKRFLPSECEGTSELGYSWPVCFPGAWPAGIWWLQHR